MLVRRGTPRAARRGGEPRDTAPDRHAALVTQGVAEGDGAARRTGGRTGAGFAVLGGAPYDHPVRRDWILATGLSIGVAAVTGTATWEFHSLLPSGRSLPGTSIAGHVQPDGVGLGDFLETRRQQLLGREAYLVLGDGTNIRVHFGDLGVELDVAASMKRALDQAQRGSLGNRLYRSWNARHGRTTVQAAWSVDTTRARATLEQLAPRVWREPVDARLDLDAHERIHDVPGRELDVAATLANIEHASREDTAVIAVATRPVAAQVTSAMIARIDVSKVLASYESDFSHHSPGRDKNIAVAAHYLDGTVLAPGQTMSFNQVVGPRRLDRGFTWAPVIVDDELESGVGGGTCQVASTTYAAAVYGGLEIVVRRSHSRPSGYVPLGLDATVVYPQVDLKVKNPYDSPLIVHAFIPKKQILRVELLGRDSIGEVKYTYGVAKTHDFYRRVTTKPWLGAKILKRQRGHKGYDVFSVVRYELADGTEKTYTYRSKYFPVPEVFWVGPGYDPFALPDMPDGAERVEARRQAGGRTGDGGRGRHRRRTRRLIRRDIAVDTGPVTFARFILAAGVGLVLALPGCKSKAKAAGAPAASGSSAPASAAAPVSSLRVDHGELDTRAPSDSPMIAAKIVAATIYKLPNTDARKLGYVRLGGKVRRDKEPVKGKGCKGVFYHVYPMGFMCTDEATIDMDEPIVRAANVRPDVSKPMPYKYGFVRATAPQYLRVPTKSEQERSEFKLEEHIAWYNEHRDEVQRVDLGADDVPLDARGIARPGLTHPAGFKLSTQLSQNELFGGRTADDPIPWWLKGGRKIPNVSGFDVPEYAVFADRVRRKTGLSFVGAFDTKDDGLERRFAVTVDMRLIPTTKVKPDTASPFHGIELSPAIPMPFCWVIKRDMTTWKLIRGRDEAEPAEAIPRRAIVPLSGNARIKAGKRFYQTLKDKTRWLRADDISIVTRPQTFPDVAAKGEKWIDISLRQQTLVLYEGMKPWYATLVSTGRDRLGDPKTQLATPQGTFRLKSKHIAAVMDSDENSAVAGGTRTNTHHGLTADDRATTERLLKAEKDGEKLGEDDQRRLANIKKGRPPEYGVTQRRGSRNFELRDVPWIQYFASGYALHGAYWHDVFGIPRSHGCVNLAPIDARVVFFWTDPPVPEGWHGVNIGPDMGEGTTVIIHE